VDAHSPLDSGLALSIPQPWREGRENGLLQVWEIFEQVRLDAELVTLSACETGLGKAFAGEGLLGLTRAFQFAGARSVLASLWRVGDAATGELMPRFYRRLAAGLPKDEALQQAQLELLRDPALAHPWNWAGFTLSGDYR
jgi:CHAT domain-containing protein